ncbi:MFS transporter [Sphingomonas trueperi]|uniref:MFS transporter n=1 Tax=Sphingomonas trueperi TaxID=53317 RepID=UPI000F1132BB
MREPVMVDVRTRAPDESWRMVVLAALGGALEYFDFIVYGIFAPAIAASFFPADDPLALTLALAIFAAGYLARPIGGMISSHYGDRYGRKIVFMVTVATMSGSTLAIGLLPTYAGAGIAATMGLLVLRVVQGLCIGGELPGAITFVVESVRRRPVFACGVVFALVNVGVLLASGLHLLLTLTLGDAALLRFGWRVAFVLGGLLGLASLWLRRRLRETPVFEAFRGDVARRPVRDVLWLQPRSVLLGVALTAPTATFNGLLFGYMPAYLTKILSYPAGEIAVAVNVALLVMSAALLAAAWLADRVRPHRLLLLSSAALLVGAPLSFQRLASGTASLVILLPILALAVAGANGTFAFLLAELFPPRHRFSGVALSLNISFTLLSGLGPLAAALLISASGALAAPGWIIAAAGGVGTVAALRLARAGSID